MLALNRCIGSLYDRLTYVAVATLHFCHILGLRTFVRFMSLSIAVATSLGWAVRTVASEVAHLATSLAFHIFSRTWFRTLFGNVAFVATVPAAALVRFALLWAVASTMASARAIGASDYHLASFLFLLFAFDTRVSNLCNTILA